MSGQEIELKEQVVFSSSNTLSRLIDEERKVKPGHRWSEKKNKHHHGNLEFKTSNECIGFQNDAFEPDKECVQDERMHSHKNGFKYEHPYSVSVEKGPGTKVLEDLQNPSQTGIRESYDSDYCANRRQTENSVASEGEKDKRKTKLVCLKILMTLLVVAVICAGVAVILKYKVFDAGDTQQEMLKVTLRPASGTITLEGSLDLKETWTSDLHDPTSLMYISFVDNFTLEIDKIMKTSLFADSYIRTDVTKLSPGSIKVDFNMRHNDKYKVHTRSASQFATLVAEEIKDGSLVSSLPIDKQTVHLNVKTWTPVLLPSQEFSFAGPSYTQPTVLLTTKTTATATGAARINTSPTSLPLVPLSSTTTEELRIPVKTLLTKLSAVHSLNSQLSTPTYSQMYSEVYGMRYFTNSFTSKDSISLSTKISSGITKTSKLQSIISFASCESSKSSEDSSVEPTLMSTSQTATHRTFVQPVSYDDSGSERASSSFFNIIPARSSSFINISFTRTFPFINVFPSYSSSFINISPARSSLFHEQRNLSFNLTSTDKRLPIMTTTPLRHFNGTLTVSYSNSAHYVGILSQLVSTLKEELKYVVNKSNSMSLTLLTKEKSSPSLDTLEKMTTVILSSDKQVLTAVSTESLFQRTKEWLSPDVVSATEFSERSVSSSVFSGPLKPVFVSTVSEPFSGTSTTTSIVGTTVSCLSLPKILSSHTRSASLSATDRSSSLAPSFSSFPFLPVSSTTLESPVRQMTSLRVSKLSLQSQDVSLSLTYVSSPKIPPASSQTLPLNSHSLSSMTGTSSTLRIISLQSFVPFSDISSPLSLPLPAAHPSSLFIEHHLSTYKTSSSHESFQYAAATTDNFKSDYVFSPSSARLFKSDIVFSSTSSDYDTSSVYSMSLTDLGSSTYSKMNLFVQLSSNLGAGKSTLSSSFSLLSLSSSPTYPSSWTESLLTSSTPENNFPKELQNVSTTVFTTLKHLSSSSEYVKSTALFPVQTSTTLVQDKVLARVSIKPSSTVSARSTTSSTVMFTTTQAFDPSTYRSEETPHTTSDGIKNTTYNEHRITSSPKGEEPLSASTKLFLTTTGYNSRYTTEEIKETPTTTRKTTTTTTKPTRHTDHTLKNNGKVLASGDDIVTNFNKLILTPAPDRRPIASAGPDIDLTLPENSAVLDGSGSRDDRGIVSYHWNKLSPSTPVEMSGADSKVLHIRKLKEGVYTFQLTVVDGAGHKDSDTVKVVVNPEPTTTVRSIDETKQDLCVPVNVDLCVKRGFTQTVYPNFFGHMTEEEALDVFNYVARSAVHTLCEEAVVTYLCSMYFPKCNPATGYFTIPCKSLCLEASTSCSSYFNNPYPCEYFSDSDCVDIITTTPVPATTRAMRTCEATRLRECTDLGFNETMYPNFFGEPEQQSSIEAFNAYFRGIVGKGCHRDALYFICSIQFPKCREGSLIKPCRNLCYDVTASCSDIAPYFDCNTYPAMDCVSPAKLPSKNTQNQIKVPKRVCKADEFTCKKTQKCLYKDKLCNGIDDCGDWTDEMECTCNQYEFQCDMGMCIKSYQECDGTAHCPDNSDESRCTGCTHGQVKCPSGKCIMKEWVCDGRAECEDAWDEINCDLCGHNQFTCSDRNHTCIDVSRRCDTVSDCPDGEDEWDCINNENGILQLRYKKFWLPICADSWTEKYGEIACTQLLGEGSYINKTDIAHNVYSFARLSPEGTYKSALGPMFIIGDCPGYNAVRISCEPRGCGKRKVDVVNYIVNGEDAAPGAWPWHVALYFGGQYFCGGTLISDTFVLTAAHCVDKFVNDYGLMTVKLGANNREEPEETQHVIKVEAIESHTDHVYFKKNDIALLQLERPVQFTKYVQPVCLPEPGDPLPLHSTCFTVGWGKKKWDGDYAEVLQQLKMTLWDTQKCNSSIAWNGEVYDTFLCAGYYSGIRSICKKDSGGPLLCLDRQNTWKLRGINSYVGNYCNMTERPNVFTNVSMFREWFDEKIECKFRCDNGKCLFYTNQICDRIDHCGDNSDEMRICNRTLNCDFEDKYLCGYEFKGWRLGYDNKLAARIEIDGQLHTQSNAPQFDHTRGRFPGQFFYGKQKEVLNAELWSPRFGTDGQTCIRFSYYQRGDINLGLSVYVKEYIKGRSDDIFSESRLWTSGRMFKGFDEWRTGYFDVSIGDFRVNFKTGDLLKTAIDDVMMIPGMCKDVLCLEHEYRCKGRIEDKCIPKESHCNLVADCIEAELVDERGCAKTPGTYICTFDDGNVCALHQEVGDASDWWLVNATFIREETGNYNFLDHTSSAADGNMFYINAYGLQTSAHINMWQLFYLHNLQYCFYFYYQMKSNVTFNIYVDCRSCVQKRYIAKPTFEDNWTLFQINLPQVDVVNVTYVVEGNERSEGFFRSFIALDDIVVEAGSCPEYVCPDNYVKCKSTDRCIPKSALCDRQVDCVDESDEEQCVCTKDEYRCSSGRCISKSFMCDRTPTCLDGSDEGDVCIPLRSVSCTFEHPYVCGYEFRQYTTFHWHRHSGRTPTPITGPIADHTFRNDSGHYMYTEANEGNKGDNASMISPDFITHRGQSFEFYYHMYSASGYEALPGVLELSLENLITGERSIQWQAPVFDLHDKWRRICVDLPDDAHIRLKFTVIRNETTIYGVDMAVDDTKLNNYRCNEATSPPPTTTRANVPEVQEQKCNDQQWDCGEGTCVPLSYRCDFEADCPNASDERNCP